MDDLVPHIDGAPICDRALHDLDRAVDTGAETARAAISRQAKGRASRSGCAVRERMRSCCRL
jgi:hypothetical protein